MPKAKAASSRKRKSREDEGEEQNNKDTAAAEQSDDFEHASTTNNNNDKLITSPPSGRGMSLRSGRKKRRRSKETTGLTPEQQNGGDSTTTTAAAKTRRATTTTRRGRPSGKEETEGSKDEDESMEVEEEEEDDEEMKEAAAAEESESEEEEDDRKQPARRTTTTSDNDDEEEATAAAATKRTRRGAATAKPMNGAAANKPAAAEQALQVAPSGARIGTRRLFPAENETPRDEEKKGEEHEIDEEEEQQQPPIVETRTVAEPPQVERHDDAEELQAIMAEGSVLPAAPDDEQAEQISWTMQLYQSASSNCLYVVSTVREVSTSLIVPATRQDDNDGEPQERVEWHERLPPWMQERMPEWTRQPAKQLWMRFDVWFVTLLLLQLVFWTSVFSPLLVSFGNSSAGLYGSLFERKAVEPPIAAPPILAPTISDTPIIVDTESSLQILRESSFRSSSIGRVQTDLSEQLFSVDRLLRAREADLVDWKESLDEAEQALLLLQAMLKDSQALNEESIDKAIDLIDDLQETSPAPLSTNLVDMSGISLPAALPKARSCDTVQHASVEDDALLTPEMLEAQEAAFRERAIASASMFESNPDAHALIRAKVREAMKHVKVGGEAVLDGLSEDDMLETIASRLELQRADQTGRTDYASLAAGASLIRFGPRPTSPSLVDTLPLVNRWLHRVRLRFYGHGPDAALTPTNPPDALGQCWSFEGTPITRKRTGAVGSLATLSVRLPEPIRVESIVIEHAMKERTDHKESAIREFRVFGYEDADASGDAVPLGAFIYDIGAGNVLQEFPVAANDDGPRLRSITLAIDSNWGHPYACLYRFRVHGS